MDFVDFDRLAASCAPTVEVRLLRQIARTESSFNPWALSVNYPNRTANQMGQQGGYARLQKQPSSKMEGIHWANRLVAQGHTVSLGLMQISSQNLDKLGHTIESAFDPCNNLKLAAELFGQKLASAKASGVTQPEHAALSLYNTGTMTLGISNGYVAKVVSAPVKAPAKVAPPVGTREREGRAAPLPTRAELAAKSSTRIRWIGAEKIE